MPNDQSTDISHSTRATAYGTAVADETRITARTPGHDLTRTGILPQLCITPAQVHRMIANAAYHRALQRGFAPGCELEDWLAAEQEIMANLL